MNFLFDECLHTSLVEVANALGHQGSHVNWLGLSGTADWDLMPRIIDGDFTFVTNNAQDFRRLYRDQAVHAGLVIFILNAALISNASFSRRRSKPLPMPRIR